MKKIGKEVCFLPVNETHPRNGEGTLINLKNGDILYLPSEEANTVSAYVGNEETPKLSALGGAEFNRLKERVKASIKQT